MAEKKGGGKADPKDAGKQGRDPKTGQFTAEGIKAGFEEAARFDSSGIRVPGPGQEAPTQQKPKPGQQAPAATGGFTFNGKTYKSQADAENMVRTLQGEFNKANQRAQAIEAQVNQAWTSAAQWRDQAYARGYSEGPNDSYAQQFPGAGQHGTAGKTDGGAAAPAAEPAKGGQAGEQGQFVSDAVLRTYGEIARRDGLEVAAAYLSQQAVMAAEQRILSQVKDRSTKADEFLSRVEKAQKMGQVYNQLASAKKPDGTPIYPELSDPGKKAVITHFWNNLGFAPDKMFEPTAAHIAVVAYREAVAQQEAQARAESAQMGPQGGAETPAGETGSEGAVEATADGGEGAQPSAAELAAEAARAASQEDSQVAGGDAVEAGTEEHTPHASPQDPEVRDILSSFEVSDEAAELGFSRE